MSVVDEAEYEQRSEQDNSEYSEREAFNTAIIQQRVLHTVYCTDIANDSVRFIVRTHLFVLPACHRQTSQIANSYCSDGSNTRHSRPFEQSDILRKMYQRMDIVRYMAVGVGWVQGAALCFC